MPALLIAPAAVHAQTGTPANTNEAIAERIEKRKTELKTKLERTQETRLKARCKAAQTLLAKAQTRSEELETRRLGSYKTLQDRVAALIDKLRANGQNVTDLEAAQSTLNIKVVSLTQAYDSYQLALSDAVAVDCTTDPTGFKATLETARQFHDNIGKAYVDLRTTIKDVLKPAIVAVKVGSEN